MGVDPDQKAYASSANAGAASSAPSSSRNNASKIASRKRTRHSTGVNPAIPIVDQYGKGANSIHGGTFEPEQDEPRTQIPKKVKAAAPAGEKRLRRFREKQPTSFAAVYERATTQRFFVLSRALCGTAECPEMWLEVSGSTGNVYNVCIARQPTCDCPHARAGNQCKHTIFVLKKVLRARHEYVYQLALLSEELREIFANCPNPADEHSDEAKDKNRKPVDGDCPICFEEMETGPGKEELVWCKAACGQNIHRQCFDMWAATKRQSSGANKITCPYCRSQWDTCGHSVNVANIKRGAPNAEGYVNVANQLGISTQRDYSTYSTWWSGHPEYHGRRESQHW